MGKKRRKSLTAQPKYPRDLEDCREVRLCANVWHFKPCHKFFDSLNFTGPDSCSRVISFSSLMSSFQIGM